MLARPSSPKGDFKVLWKTLSPNTRWWMLEKRHVMWLSGLHVYMYGIVTHKHTCAHTCTQHMYNLLIKKEKRAFTINDGEKTGCRHMNEDGLSMYITKNLVHLSCKIRIVEGLPILLVFLKNLLTFWTFFSFLLLLWILFFPNVFYIWVWFSHPFLAARWAGIGFWRPLDKVLDSQKLPF